MTTPDEIRAQIEATRADLSTNVNTLADTVNPPTPQTTGGQGQGRSRRS